MQGAFTIPCELTIVPGSGPSEQTKLILRASGENVFCDYEDHLTDSQLEVVKQIARTHACVLNKWAEKSKK